jgi:imidazolonepropionase-like amidohydrolase
MASPGAACIFPYAPGVVPPSSSSRIASMTLHRNPLRPSLAAALFASLAAAVPAAAQARMPEREDVAFVGVTVVPMTPGDSVLRDRTVLVRGGRIAAVGAVSEVEVPDDVRRIDGRGKYLMPGLADMHVHLEHFDDPALLALFVANGVTTVRNMDGRPKVLEWRRAAADGALLGPRIVTAGPILDGDPPLLDDNTVVRTAEEARAAVRAQVAAGYDFVKVYTNLSPEAYRAVVDEAGRAGVAVAGHVPRALEVADVVEAGQRSIEHLSDFDGMIEAAGSPFRGRWHWSKRLLGMPADTAAMRVAAEWLAASEVWVVPTLTEPERGMMTAEEVRAWAAGPTAAYLPPEARGFWEKAMGRRTGRMDADDWALVRRGRENRLALVGALHRAGARLLLGTDTPNPFVVPGFSVHEELAALVAAGMPPAAALAAATREPARFLGRLDEAGTVEAGKRADLLLLDANPLDEVAHAARPAGVMLAGRWLPRERLDAMLRELERR